MSILDERRYVDSMTRKEVQEGLKKGHPLVPGYMLGVRAKEFQLNDELLKVLEDQAGLPHPGTTIIDKLEEYLRNPDMAKRLQPQQLQSPVGPQAMRGMQAPGVKPQAGPPGGPGPMPPGGPPGAGAPMPGPQAPGGAGGSMPGMPQGPPGAGGPMMASGGMIPRYQEGSVVEEEDDVFGPFDNPWIRGTDWLRPKSKLDYGILGLSTAAALSGVGTPAGLVGYGRYGLGKGATALGGLGARMAPNAVRNILATIGHSKLPLRGAVGSSASAWSKGVNMAAHPFRTIASGIGSLRVPFAGTSIGEAIGTPLARMSTQGGIRGRISDFLTGGPQRFMKPATGTPASGVMPQPLKGPLKPPSTGPLGKPTVKGFQAASDDFVPGASSVAADVFAGRAGARGLTAAAAYNILGGLGGDPQSPNVLNTIPADPDGPSPPRDRDRDRDTAGDDYGSWLENEIRAMRTLASTPTPEEEAYYTDLLERETELRGQRDRYRAAGRKSAQADALIGVSEFLGRRGRPDQLTMGGVGALMGAGADKRQAYLDELGESAFDVGSLESEQRAARSVAGRELLNTELQAMIEDRKAEQRLNELMLTLEGRGDEAKIAALRSLLESALVQKPDSAMVKAIQRRLFEYVGMSAEDLDAIALEGI